MATANKIIEKDNIFVRPYLSANNPKIYEPIHIPIVVAKVKFPASAVVSPKSLIIKTKINDNKNISRPSAAYPNTAPINVLI